MSRTIKILFIFVFVGAFGVIGYSVVQKSAHSQDEPLLSSTTTGSAVPINSTPSSTDQQIADILGLLSNLQGVKLNTNFFTSPEFLSLVDLSQPIPAATNIGRPNPFAPIGVDLGTVPQDGTFGGTGTTGGSTGGTTTGGTTTTESNAVTTNPATQVGRTTAMVSGAVTGTNTTGTKSFFYGTTPDAILRAPASATTGQNFSATLTGLSPNTTYYVKAVIEVGGISISGATLTFKTTN